MSFDQMGISPYVEGESETLSIPQVSLLDVLPHLGVEIADAQTKLFWGEFCDLQ